MELDVCVFDSCGDQLPLPVSVLLCHRLHEPEFSLFKVLADEVMEPREVGLADGVTVDRLWVFSLRLRLAIGLRLLPGDVLVQLFLEQGGEVSRLDELVGDLGHLGCSYGYVDGVWVG